MAEPSAHPHHVVPVGVYLTVFAALCAGTVLTVWAAGHDVGALNTPIALGIATTKATLVILYFMHVRYGPRLVTLMVSIGFVFLALLILFTLGDYISRPWAIVPGS
jgi:cytochrome c oxidase subunit IV